MCVVCVKCKWEEAIKNSAISRWTIRTEKDERCRKGSDDGSITTLLHDPIDDGNSETAENCGQSTHAHVWDVVLRVIVTNGLEVETTIESNEPTSEAKEKLCKGWMHVEIVFSRYVVSRKFSEMNFVKPK